MFKKTVLAIVLAFVFVVSTTSKILAADPEVVAEFTGPLTFAYPLVSATIYYAMAVDVPGSPTITEIQLPLAVYTGFSGSVIVELCEDANGQPAPTPVLQLTKVVSELPMHYDGGEWQFFNTGTPVSLTPGTHWIVCRLTSASNASIYWYGPSGYDNLYGTWYDTKSSTDSGSTWSLVMYEFYFKLFGSRVATDTRTTVVPDPNAVEVSKTSTITVIVTDPNGNPCRGTVNLSATAGTFDHNSVTLNISGMAWADWTAPALLDSYTITANFPSGQGYDGLDYNPSSNDVDITVQEFTGIRDTNTAVALSKHTVKTHEQITVTATVTDQSGVPVTVDAGKVDFRADAGTFSSTLVSVSSGAASTNWTAPDTNGPYDIYAYYRGHGTGTYKFRTSSDSNNVDVEYRDFYTVTTLTISPTHPYIEKGTFVIAEVEDQSSGDPIPAGPVRFSAQQGSFDSNDITIAKGKGHTKWTAPSSDGDITITATFAPDEPYIAGGNRYFSSADSDNAHVTKDYDSEGTDLAWMSQWVSDYDENPLPNAEKQVRGFTNKLTALGWDPKEFSNSDARASRMRGLPTWNDENKYMDKRDFTIYNGHGNPDYITFLTPWYDKHLDTWETVDLLGNPTWGDKDADWCALKTCKALSNPDDWADAMDGLHLICGFHTNAESDPCFGLMFANFLIQDTPDDRPHTIIQSWFLAADQTHKNDKAQRVVGENEDMEDDYLWGQGPVAADPSPTGAYKCWFHDVNNHTPEANAGGPYVVEVNQPVYLDGSGTTDADTYDGAKNYFRWDMDITVNSDPNDYDLDGADESDDDRNCYGRYGNGPSRHVYSVPGLYNIRLIVRDDTSNVDDDYTTVNVIVPPKSGGPAPAQSPEELPEIIDNFNPAELPNETPLPMFQMADTLLGYNDMLNVAAYFGCMKDTAVRDQTGNYSFINGSGEMLINQYTGSVMYFDRSRAYIFSNPTPALPTDSQAITLANNFLGANGMLTPDVNFVNVTTICAQDRQKANRNIIISNTPYQKRVNYNRFLDVNSISYPVVGSGGKITVMVDETSDVRMFIKVMRELVPAMDLPLIGADIAVQKFHDLGTDALIRAGRLPICETIYIDKVALGYYEDNFHTFQEWVPPVYILDLTCDCEEYSEKSQVYISAITGPLDANIISPADNAIYDTNSPITFTGSVQGGTPPYTYQWHSDTDGLLSSSLSFATSSLSERFLTEPNSCQPIPHTISFTVTDSYNFKSTELVQLTVCARCSDFDCDNFVDFEDFAEIADAWLTEPPLDEYKERLDINNDAVIDNKDLDLLTSEWLK